jgi:outer membrane protein
MAVDSRDTREACGADCRSDRHRGAYRQKGRSVRLLLAASSFVLGGLLPHALHAETLTEALVRAYQTNPTLDAQRANQRATDEEVPKALSGWRPVITTGASYGHLDNTTRARTQVGKVTSHYTTDPGQFQINLGQPIFNGFQTVNSTRQAEATVMAGRGQLAAVEQSVLLQAIQAYMNVIRDRRILDLRRANVQVLEEELRSTRARFEVGDNTRTDVAQAESRLAQSRSALTSAEAALAISVGTYIQVIGQAPGKLVFPPAADRLLPKTIDAAIQIAELNNPNVIASEFSEKAQGFAVEVQKGNLLPSASLNANYTKSFDPSPSTIWNESFSITGQVSVPIYQGGAEYASVRQAKQLRNQRQVEIVETRRSVREAVVRAWNQLVAARETVKSAQEQVRAQTLAYQGVKLEAEAGTRTTLDVLNAEQELVSARVAVVQAEVDAIVASYAVAAAIGKLTATDLGLPVATYDPRVYYDKVRNKWFGLDTPSPQ